MKTLVEFLTNRQSRRDGGHQNSGGATVIFGQHGIQRLGAIGSAKIGANFRAFEQLRLNVPNLNYHLRKYRISQKGVKVDWLLGEIPVCEPLA